MLTITIGPTPTITPKGVFELACALASYTPTIGTEALVADKYCINRIKDLCLDIFRDTASSNIGRLFCSLLLTKKPSVGIQFLEEAGVLGVVLPELSSCVGVEQDKRYHIDDVFTHSIKVCDLCESPQVSLPLRWAGLLHDIGKKDAYNKTKDGNITFHKHEVYSTSLAKKVLNRLCKDAWFVEQACNLISMHNYYYSSIWSDKAIRRFVKRAEITEHDCENMKDIPLFCLRRADRASRDLIPVTPKQQVFEDRIKEFLRP